MGALGAALATAVRVIDRVHGGTTNLRATTQPAGATGQSGMIELINSRFDYNIFDQIGGQAFAPSVKMRPNIGSMLVFPSTLLHFVFPNETDEERISLAWNLRFIRK